MKKFIKQPQNGMKKEELYSTLVLDADGINRNHKYRKR